MGERIIDQTIPESVSSKMPLRENPMANSVPVTDPYYGELKENDLQKQEEALQLYEQYK